MMGRIQNTRERETSQNIGETLINCFNKINSIRGQAIKEGKEKKGFSCKVLLGKEKV